MFRAVSAITDIILQANSSVVAQLFEAENAFLMRSLCGVFVTLLEVDLKICLQMGLRY